MVQGQSQTSGRGFGGGGVWGGGVRPRQQPLLQLGLQRLQGWEESILHGIPWETCCYCTELGRERRLEQKYTTTNTKQTNKQTNLHSLKPRRDHTSRHSFTIHLRKVKSGLLLYHVLTGGPSLKKKCKKRWGSSLLVSDTLATLHYNLLSV